MNSFLNASFIVAIPEYFQIIECDRHFILLFMKLREIYDVRTMTKYGHATRLQATAYSSRKLITVAASAGDR